MGIALVRLPAYKLNLSIFTGRIDREELLDFYRDLDETDPANANPILTYMDPDVDLSGLDIVAFARLRPIMAPKLKVLAQNPGFHCIVVCHSAQCEAITRFWRAFLARDPSQPPLPIFFTDLKRACEWLERPGAATLAAVGAVQDQHVQPTPAEGAARIQP